VEQTHILSGYLVRALGILPRTPSVESPVVPGEGWKEGEVRNTLEDEEDFTREGEEDDEDEDAPADLEPEEEAPETSLDEILAKKPEERPAPEEEEDEESILSMGRDDRIETLSVRVEPKKDTEFVCQNCHLVKPIRSQLADKKRMFCRDCA
jgi:Domain of unknown function (DUF4193)